MNSYKVSWRSYGQPRHNLHTIHRTTSTVKLTQPCTQQNGDLFMAYSMKNKFAFYFVQKLHFNKYSSCICTTLNISNHTNYIINYTSMVQIYLLLTEFEGRTVSTKLFPPRFMAQARSAQAINRRGKTRIRNLRYGPRKGG